MFQEMMKECCGKSGEPEFGKMKEFMRGHDHGARLDAVGWALFFIWIGVAWIAEVGIGIALLGVAAITLAMQLLRKRRGLKVEIFWVVAGVALGIGGLWEFFDIQMPLAPLVLIIAGIALLVWQFAPWRKESQESHS